MTDLAASLAQAKLSLAGEVPKPGKTVDTAAAHAAAKSFEAYFLSQFLSEMFKGIKSDSLFGGGVGEEAYRPMLIAEYGKLMAARGGTGIADSVMREILSTQEVGK